MKRWISIFAALMSGASMAAVFAPIDENIFGIRLPYIPPPSSLDLRIEGDALGPLMGFSLTNKIAEIRGDLRLAALSEFLLQGNLPLAAMALENIRRTTPPRVWSQLPLGDIYYEMGWYDQAAEFSQNALAFEPELEIGRRVLVASLIMAKKPEAAVVAAKQYTGLKPDNSLAHYLLARALYASGRTNEAFRSIETALLLDERRADALQMKAQMLLDTKKAKEALDTAYKCRQVLGGNGNVDLTLLLGRACLEVNDLENGEKYLREAADGDSPRLDAVLALTRFLEGTKRQEAIGILEKAVAKDSDSVPLHIELARLYAAELRTADAERERAAVAFLQGRVEEAMEAVLDATSKAPDQPVNFVKASALLQEHGEIAAAMSMSAKAYARFPRDSEVVVRYARLLAATDKTEEAARILDTATPEIRQQQNVMIERARLYAASGDIARALELVNPLLPFTRLLDAFSLAGKWRLQTGDIRGARDVYARGLRLAPRDGELLNGYVYTAMLGSAIPADLLTMARKAAELLPDDPAVADTLGWVLAETGGVEEALRVLGDVVEKMPDNPSASYHLAIALLRDGQTDAALKRVRELIVSGKKFPERKSAQALLDHFAPL